MSKGDRLSGIFWFVISLVIAVESYRIGVGQLHAPRPGFLPFFASLLLGVLSLSLLFSARKKRKQGTSEEPEDVAFNTQLLPKVLYTLGSLFLYSIFLNLLGFLLASVILMGFLLRAIEPQKWYVVTLGAILIPVIASLVFDWCLGVQLPTGVLGF